jgi:chorismate mutase-like protein
MNNASRNNRMSSENITPFASPHDGGIAHLEALRAELDATDVQLLEAVRHRLDICARIGHHKKAYAIPMMQPQRIGVVQERAAAFAAAHAIQPEFLRALYTLIIDETCRLEETIIAKT